MHSSKNKSRISNSTPPFCGSKHPLSKYGPPDGRSISEDQRYPGLDENAECTSRPCSGVLTESQSTIATSAHCAHGMTPKQFCQQFVFVFNRTEKQQDKNNGQNFSQNEIFECESGLMSDTTANTKNFNLHSDQESKDHAFFSLTRSVPKQTAEAVKLRQNQVVESEELYAIGHPYGTPRTVSTLKSTRRTANSNNNYSYIQARGYAYGGNSGGPLLDTSGQLVGILSSTDDNEHGAPAVREPMVKPESGHPPICRTQLTNSLVVESIGIGTDFKKALGRLKGPSLYKPDGYSSDKAKSTE
jgi:V8-like Glu-specific endopeptidase